MAIQLYLPETRYVVASIPLDQYHSLVECLRNVEGFVSLIRDKYEITLMVSEDIWLRLEPQFPGSTARGHWRMIRFDTYLDFSVIGFIAEISRALAEAEISILSVSSFSTDTVLVQDSRFDDAVTAVKQALTTLQFTHLAQH